MIRALVVIGLFTQALLAQDTVVLQGDWGKTGINIVPYDSSPGFRRLAESSAEPALSQSGIDLSGVLPYSFVLRNNSAQTIAGISARWVTTDADGKVLTHDRTWTGIQSPKEGILPLHSDRLVIPLNSASLNIPNAISNMQKAAVSIQREFAKKVVVASLEVVILDDGRALGSDSANVVSELSARLDAEREVLAGVVTMMPKGKSAVVEYLSGLIDPRPTVGRIDASRETTAAGAYAKFFSVYRTDWARIYISMAEANLAILKSLAEARLNAPRFAIYR
jgi:hypothetical protein